MTGSFFAADCAGTSPLISVSTMLTAIMTIPCHTGSAASVEMPVRAPKIKLIGIDKSYVTPTPIAPANRPIKNVSALKRFLISRFLAPSDRRTPISFVRSTTET